MATVGAGLLLVGSFVPWVTVDTAFGTLNKNGIDGDGKLTAATGILALLLIAVGASTRERILLAVGAVISAAGGAIGIYDGVDIGRAASDITSNYATATVGIGIYVTIAGGLMGFIAGMIVQSDLA